MIQSILIAVATTSFLAACWYEWQVVRSVRQGYEWTLRVSSQGDEEIPDFALTAAGREARRKTWIACLVLGLSLAALLPTLDLISKATP